MATFFFRLFMAPSGAAAEKLENHLSSLSFIIIITVVIVWWPKACAFIRYFVSFFFVEFSLEIKGRVSRWSHKVALFNSQTISATRCHFIKQKRIKFIQNWHVQSGAVSFVSGRVRLQMMMLSDCWLLHPIKNPLIDDHPSTCSARNLRHRCPCLRLELGRFHSFCRLRLVWISQSGQNGVAFHSFEMAAVVARPSAPRYPSAALIDIYSTRTAPIDFGGSPPTE